MSESLPNSYPPHGVRLKLRRAHEHLVMLDKEIKAFHMIQPYRMVHETWADDTVHILRAEITQGLPEMLPVILGDCLQNMRAALEHLAWELVVVGDGAPGSKTGFPIFKDDPFAPDADKRLTNSFRNKVRSMPEEAIAILKRLQPHLGDDPEHEFLWLLNEYANIDRHQTLNVVLAISDYIDAQPGKRDNYGKFIPDDSNVLDDMMVNDVFVHGAELYRATLREPDPNMKMEYNSPLYITFGKAREVMGKPAVDILQGMLRYIEQIVLPQFVRFF